MTSLPIVARELRVASRKRGTYWGRASAAAAVLVIGTWAYLMNEQEAPAIVAKILFGIMTGSATLYGLFCGLWSTADCLSQEKRDGTLGLLFLTDLRGYDVVLGKLAATSLNAIYSVVAILPTLAVPFLIGGVTPGEFGRMALVIVNTLFFSLTLGICVSSISRSSRKALVVTLLGILFFAALSPGVGAWLEATSKPKWLFEALLMPSAGFTFATAFDDLYKTMGQEFWWSLGVIHVLSWLFLLFASLVAPRSWQDKPLGPRARSWRDQWRLWSYGEPSERGAYRRRLLNQNAYFWLAARARLRPAYVWITLGLVGCIWGWGLAKFHREWLMPFMYFLTALFLNLLLKCWVAAEAGRQLAEDRQQGTLELLLSTPLTVQDIVRGERLALQRQFLGPLVVTLVLFLTFLGATLSDTGDDSDRALWTWLYLAGIVSLVADLAALHWVGMWRGLTAKNPQRAMMGSMTRIFVLPWAGMGLAVLIIAIAATVGQFDPGFAAFPVFLWLALSLTVDIGYAAWARSKLLAEFRLAASERYAQKRGFWRSLFSRS